MIGCMSRARTPLLVEIEKPGYLPEHFGEMVLSHLRVFNPAPRDRQRAIDNVMPVVTGYLHGILDRVAPRVDPIPRPRT